MCSIKIDDPWFNRAGCSVLGRASNTEIYRPLENHSKVRGRSYCLIFVFYLYSVCVTINILFQDTFRTGYFTLSLKLIKSHCNNKWWITISVMMQLILWVKLSQSRFPFSATRCLEWRSWITTGLFTTATAASSGRRWAGCWAWHQRRSAAGRRPGKPWRNGRERPPSTLWYDHHNHWMSRVVVHTIKSKLISVSYCFSSLLQSLGKRHCKHIVFLRKWVL